MHNSLRIEKHWTISNVLSISRVVLLVPIVMLILRQGDEHRVTVLILMLAAAATDFLDGFLARAMHEITDFGRLLDPVADKICVVVAVVALVLAGDVPLWYAILIAIRDCLILVGGSLILAKRKIVVQSVWTGKFTVNFIAMYIILATLRMDALSGVKDFFLYLSTVFLFISLSVYFMIYRKHMVGNGIA